MRSGPNRVASRTPRRPRPAAAPASAAARPAAAHKGYTAKGDGHAAAARRGPSRSRSAPCRPLRRAGRKAGESVPSKRAERPIKSGSAGSALPCPAYMARCSTFAAASPRRRAMTFLRALFLAFALLIAAPPSPRPPAMPTGSTAARDIARDPAWRFGTLPNGLRYAVRRNALAGGAGLDPHPDRRRLAARGGQGARLGAFRRAYAVPRHRELSGPAGARDLAAAGRELRQRHQRPHRRHPDRLHARTCPTPTARRSTPASPCSPR